MSRTAGLPYRTVIRSRLATTRRRLSKYSAPVRRPASPVFIPLASAPVVGGALRSRTVTSSAGGRDWVHASTASAPSNCVFSPSPALTRARSAPMRSSQPTRSAAMTAQALDTAGGIIPPEQ